MWVQVVFQIHSLSHHCECDCSRPVAQKSKQKQPKFPLSKLKSKIFLLQDDNAAVFNDLDPALNNPDFSLEMGYPQESSY